MKQFRSLIFSIVLILAMAGIIVLIRSIRKETHHLFTNATDQSFHTVTGFGDVKRQGVCVLDYDHDGHLDLFFPGYARNSLLKNDGKAHFTDASSSAGIELDRPLGTSCLTVDIDNDGDVDILVGHGLIEGDGLDGAYNPDEGGITIFENQLAQTGIATFVPITPLSFPVGEYPNDGRYHRYVTGISAADVDGDGYLDLYQTDRNDRDFENYREKKHRGAKNILWHNLGIQSNGHVAFTNITDTSAKHQQLAGIPNPDQFKPSDNIPGLTTDAKGRFVGDVPGNITQSSLFTDIDNDGDPDLIVANDFPDSFRIFRNDSKNGIITFTDITNTLATMGGWMGIDSGDIDHDGDVDLFLTNVGATNAHRWSSELLLNDGHGTFRDIGSQNHIIPDPKIPNIDGDKHPVSFTSYEYGWGCIFIDIDNDGDNDLFYFGSSGVPSYYLQTAKDAPITSMSAAGGKDNPGRLFRNDGNTWWTEITSLGGVYDVYQDKENNILTGENGSGIAFGDFNEDGFVDIVLANGSYYWGKPTAHPALLFLNNKNSNKSISITLEGTHSNRSAIGAKISLLADRIWQTKEVKAGLGFAGNSMQMLQFGIGKATIIDKLIVTWPNELIHGKTVQGKSEVFTHMSAGHIQIKQAQ